jgi:hypothetical protein
MIKEAMAYLLDLAKPAISKSEDGREFWTLTEHGISDPLPSSLGLSTLTGIIDWLESCDYRDCLIHVYSTTTIQVISSYMEKWEQRKCFVESRCVESEFNFGQFMSIESFIINVQSKFAETFDKPKLIKYIANIRGQHITESEDDGITQEVTVRDGIGRLEGATLDPIVKLAPYRTFREIKQPESDFLLRLKAGAEGKLPTVALFESDGARWKNDAILAIAAWLKSQDVIKDKNIDVLA